ncbi:MAG: hypothetical protein M1812_002895 [Candelaria pacifica]|nr:MAG: hypothetical protein M1812_002895 [Candelaria pacifica]
MAAAGKQVAAAGFKSSDSWRYMRGCSKVVCVGRNYADHITELENARPKQPFFFLKPSTSITKSLGKSESHVYRPAGVDLHYEVELAVIVGKTLRDLQAENEASAMWAIQGKSTIMRYAVAIDMTARNVQDEAKKKGLPWTIAKGFDTFLPMSRFIPKQAIPDPHNAHLWLSVNNEMRQSDSTKLMLFQIPRLLSDISKVMTLRRADIVLTGTPKGVGPVNTGDVMRAGIKVDGQDIEEGNIEISVKDREGSSYNFSET